MFFFQELRKTLSVVKIEKEDIEAALNDSRKELQALEQKNKVSLSTEITPYKILYSISDPILPFPT